MRAWPTTPIDLAQTRHPGELSAEKFMLYGAIPAVFALLLYVLVTFGLLLLAVAVYAAIYFFIEWTMLSYFRGHGVLVGKQQYPEIDAMAETFSARLGVPRPEIYVVQNSLWNAFAAKVVGSRIVVLYSGAIDALLLGGNPEDLGFLVGHELGHHACGHLDWRYRLVRLGAWVPFLGMYHRRCMELSCDRIALACVGSTAIATRGLLSMTVGTTLMAHTSVAAMREQWRSAKRQIGVTLLTFYSTYPPHLERLESVLTAGEKWGLGQPAGPRPEMSPLLPARPAAPPPTRPLPPPPATTATVPPAPAAVGAPAAGALPTAAPLV